MKLPDFDVTDANSPPIMTDEMISLIVAVIKESSGKLVSKAAARIVYETVLRTMFTETARVGQFRLTGGWGQFILKYIPESTRLVFGKETVVPAKSYIRYREGAACKEMLGRTVPGDYQRKKPRTKAS